MKTFNQHLHFNPPHDLLPPRLRRTMLGLKGDPSAKMWAAVIELGAFRPCGLIIWNAPAGSMMTQTLVGNMQQILAGWSPLPTELFSHSKSFEQIEEGLKEGLEPPTWPDFDSAYVGNIIRVYLGDENGQPLYDPKVRMAFWGYTAFPSM